MTDNNSNIYKRRTFNKEEIKSKPKNENTFRLNAKNLFLTYFHSSITREEILSQLSVILNKKIKEYIIGEKLNDLEKSSKHIYVFLNLNTTINITNSRKLDLIDPKTGLGIHGHYESAKNKINLINFIKNIDKNYLSNLGGDFNIQLKKIADEDGFYAAMEYFEKTKPEKVITSFGLIASNLKEYCNLKSNLDFENDFAELKNWSTELENDSAELKKWSTELKNDSTKSSTSLQILFDFLKHNNAQSAFIVVDPRENKKTQAMISLLKEIGFKIFKINDIPNLFELNIKKRT